MPSRDDAFGEALLACFDDRPDERVLVLEVDDGRSGPAMHPTEFFKAPDEWPAWERELLADVEGPVLDLGCGAGRHGLWLQDRGLDVTAIDNSPGAVAVCRQRGLRDVRLGDLRDPPQDKPWRTVLLLCGNLGLAGGWHETRDLLRKLHDVCAKEAVLVGDSVDPTRNGDPRAVAYRDAKAASGRHPGEIVLRLRFGGYVSSYWSLLNLPPADLEPLVSGTGWTVERHIVDGLSHATTLRRA